ncbi:MAG: TetR family transcriptional regulator [Steroidobacteraceae bacterium]|jgi:AcrR family transcriptional regulator
MSPSRKSAAAGEPADRNPKRKAARGRPVGRGATRENILRAALEVFAKHGFAGARVEKISKAAHSTDRMIYYYFGSKERLFVAVLESIYEELGAAEAALDLAGMSPEDGLRAIVRFTWNYYCEHPELLSLLNNENMYQGRHLIHSKKVQELSFPLLSILSTIYAQGLQQRVFRPGVVVQDLYIAICGLGYFYLSNRFTLSAFLGTDLMAPVALGNWPQVMEDAVLRFVTTEHPGARTDAD